MRYLILLLLTGCTPYIGYTHLSQPNVRDDGYDLVCGGVETEKGPLRVDVAACENLASNGGTYAKVDAKILFGKKK